MSVFRPGVISPGLPGGPWGRALVRLVSSLPWLPSSKGQTSTLFHLRSCRSQKPFCSGLQWGFSTMHIHRAPATHTHTIHTVRHNTHTHYFPSCSSFTGIYQSVYEVNSLLFVPHPAIFRTCSVSSFTTALCVWPVISEIRWTQEIKTSKTCHNSQFIGQISSWLQEMFKSEKLEAENKVFFLLSRDK